MRGLRLNRITAWVLGLVSLFLLMLILATASLVWNTRQATLNDSEEQAVRFVSGAEVTLNRSLLGIDVLLASMDELMGLSNLVVPWIDPKASSQMMHGAVQQNMMVRYVALMDAQGKVLASSDSAGPKLETSLPAGFVDLVLAQPVSTLIISPAVVSFASSERVLYFARYIKLADSTKILAVAEVQLPLLTSIMIQGVDIEGLEVTLERGNGLLLASVPPQDQHMGKLLVPALGVQDDVAHKTRMASRLSGLPAIVVTRPTLYRDLLIVASIPIESALGDWQIRRNFIVGVALLFALMILASGGFALWYLNRLMQARQSIARSKLSMDQALESMVGGFLLLNAQKQTLSWNQRFLEIYPWLAHVMVPMVPFEKIMETGSTNMLPTASASEREEWIKDRMLLQSHAQGTHEQHLPSGQVIQITERRTPDGGVVIVYQDVTELRVATAEVEHLAFFDPLTNLPNRRLLMDRLQQAIAAGTRNGRWGAVLFLDLDHFKTLNDTLGHDLGDLLLKQVAARLKTSVRDDDTVARLGGDEFVIMLEDLSGSSHEAADIARRLGEKILDQLNQNYQLSGHSYHSTPSIGATVFGGENLAAAELIVQADIAMYQVKSIGRNGLCFFDPQMQIAITARAQLEKDLRVALSGQQFELYYQPQLQRSGRIVGAEVLLRWKHPLRGLVSPVEFIPVAEESDLIMPIGDWVLRTACQQLATWQQDERFWELQLSVNVSARQLQQPDFVAQVATVIHDTGARPHLLKLELTESVVLASVDDSIAKMNALKKLGVQFSVDDFGTGHSSLAYLTRLPLDQLKIDQSFVRNIGIQRTDGVIVQTIIGMARNLGLEVIAEGVETLAQQEFLASHGCTLYQGYLFGRPTPLAAFESLLAETSA